MHRVTKSPAFPEDEQRVLILFLWAWPALGAVALAIYLFGWWPQEKINGWLAVPMLTAIFVLPASAWTALRLRSWRWFWPGLASLALCGSACYCEGLP